MPSAVSPNPRAGSAMPDELDHLLDYGDAVQDFLRDIPMNDDDQNNDTKTNEQPRDEDQEIQVRKKRKPVPKLDENLLLSQNGIPKLRKIAKTKLKFRGKGHEFSDISRLLNTYQLWLDDLYPRAKFRDALTIAEKVGHSKRMQVMRKAWLDDTKPHRRDPSPEMEMSGGNDNVENDEQPESAMQDRRADAIAAEGFVNESAQSKAGQTTDAPEDDELDAMLAEGSQSEPVTRSRIGPFEEESDDELDAILAEAETGRNNARPTHETQDEPDADDLDALMAEQPRVVPVPKPVPAISPADPDFADDEEAMASMGW